MASKEIRDLDANATPTGTDLMVVQDASSPFATEKVTLANLFAKTQEALREYRLSLLDLRIHDAVTTYLPTAAAADDLGLIAGTFGTNAVVVRTSDAKATTVTQYARYRWPVPYTYDDAATFKIRLNAGMNTTVSDGTATVDLQVYRNAAPSADICGTAAADINNITAADKDFTITATNIVKGDELDIRITIAITDSATGTAVLGEITEWSIVADSTH
jgi:hypothetical protein